MFKEGDSITINGKEYIVAKCAPNTKRCLMCTRHNSTMPCFSQGWAPTNTWSQQKCVAELPADCYVHLKSSKTQED